MQSELGNSCGAVRVLVLTGLGLNCEAETAQGFRMCGAQVQLVHLSDALSHRMSPPLKGFDILALVGGFSFGDHIAAGAVYANRLRHRLRNDLQEFVANEGLVLGICNGFQTMVRLGLVPGLDGDYQTQRVSLAANDRLGYRDAWVRLRVESRSPCIWTRGIRFIDLPSRHGEGKVLAESDDCLRRIEEQGLVAMRYVNEQGEPTQSWPANPNGSQNAIAGLCDPTGRLFGLMPHPDAYLYGFHHPQWQRRKLLGLLQERGEGLAIFQNGVEYVARRIAAGSKGQGVLMNQVCRLSRGICR